MRSNVSPAVGASALLLLGAIAGGPGVRAEEGPWKAGASFNITTGKYGTEDRTTITQLPFTLDRIFDRGLLGLTIPFMTIRTNGAVTLIGGRPQRSQGPSGHVQNVTSHSGLGDILLRGEWRLWKEQDLLPETTLTSKIKFPTASRRKELGTGEFDESVGADFWKTLVDPWSALAGAGYTFVGNPPGEDLNDAWNYYLGTGYNFRDDLLGSVVLENSRSVTPGGSNPLDLFFNVTYSGRDSLILDSNLQFGLSNGSPDIGFTLGAAIRFAKLPFED